MNVSSATNSPLTVVALGGNAISVPGKEGTIDQQFEQARQTAKVLVDAIVQGQRLVITHGNGPQVGNILRRVEIASEELYPIPLEVCVADTQAGMGYMIGQCLLNEAHARGHQLSTATIVTTVLVDERDQAFQCPTKPIGPRMAKRDAEAHADRDGWTTCEVEPGIYRRIVPSPQPKQILEIETIKALIDDGTVVICCGGGGIPVVSDDGGYRGAAAVVDKDYTSELLASALKADRLVMLTAVEHVLANYQQPTERKLETVTVAEVEALAAANHFATGSMLPKIEAAIRFVRQNDNPNAEAIVTRPATFLAALQRTTGTRIVA